MTTSDSDKNVRKLRMVIEHMPVMLDAFDENLGIIVWNKECERVTGYGANEIIGNPKAMELLYPDKDYLQKMQSLWIERGNDYHNWEWEVMAKDGSQKTIAWSNISKKFPVPGWFAWGIGIDVTDRTRVTRQLLKSMEDLSIRNRLTRIFLNASDDALFGELLKVALEASSSKFGTCGYINENGDMVSPAISRQIWDKCRVSGKSIVYPHEKWGDGIWVRAIREKKAKYANEPSLNIPEGHCPVRRNLAVPIVCGDKAIGVLHVADRDEDYRESDIDRLTTIADYIAPILETRLDRDRQEKKRRESEASLLASEIRYRAVVEKIGDGVAIIQDKRFIYTNDSFLRMFGYDDSTKQAVRRGKQWLTHKFRSDYPALFRRLSEEDIGDEKIQEQYLQSGGIAYWIEISRTAITHDQNPAILYTFHDVTEAMRHGLQAQAEAARLHSENIMLRSTIQERYRFRNIIGKSPAMQEVYEKIIKAAATDASAVIIGESGTGKDLVATAIHELGKRSNNPLVPVNCSAIPETLVESEFFGYRKGAFTGASMDKHGFIRSTDGGTLFLDEVEDIDPRMQAKLLRTIETGEFIPIGANKPLKADVRIIVASNRNMEKLVEEGRLRRDFYYRIAVISIHLPALRERREDIPLLAEHFWKHFCKGKDSDRIPSKIMDRLFEYNWPGNVRELQSAIQRYLSMGDLGLPVMLPNSPPNDHYGRSVIEGANLKEAVMEFEGRHIRRVLENNQWHRTRAAQILGIDSKTLYRKMKQLGIS